MTHFRYLLKRNAVAVALFLALASGYKTTTAQCDQRTLVDTAAPHASIAISGSTAIVATDSGETPSPTDGIASIFRFDGSSWVLEADDLGPAGYRGQSVAIHDDVAVATTTETAFVYRRDDGLWSLEAEIPIRPDARVVVSAVHADTLMVGLVMVGESQGQARRIAVFTFDGLTWSKTQEIISSADPEYRFGVSISLEGDWAVVGSPGIASIFSSPTVSIYRRSSSEWIWTADFLRPLVGSTRFGEAVALSWPWVVVGDPGSEDAAFVYRHRESGWTSAGTVTPDDAPNTNSFGDSVSIDNDALLVGASGDDDVRLGSGSVYLYRLVDDAWAQYLEFKSTEPKRAGGFGKAVSLSGPIAIVADTMGGIYSVELGPVDCDANGIADYEELAFGLAYDCQRNCMLDHCELDAGTSYDCNTDTIPDECQADCNNNGMHDSCDIANGTSQDCQRNGIPDECDIIRSPEGFSAFTVDVDGNGIPDECEPPACNELFCNGQPCASLKAVAVNDAGLQADNCVQALPGDMVEAEIRISGWGSAIDALGSYITRLLLSPAARSGDAGMVLPVGWDASIVSGECTSTSDCPVDYTCRSGRGQCIGPDHTPGLGAFVDTSRPDYVFASGVAAIATVTTTLRFSFQGVSSEKAQVVDSGEEFYAGTLRLEISDDACGTFVVPVVPFNVQGPEPTVFGSVLYSHLVYPDVMPLVIETPECDCNKNGIADPLEVESGDAADCNENFVPDACDLLACEGDPGCSDCNENGILDACDIASGVSTDEDLDGRPDECFVPIPTLSHWGVAVLALGLLVVMKIRHFRERDTGSDHVEIS